MLTNEMMAFFRITEQGPRTFRKIPKENLGRLAHQRGFCGQTLHGNESTY